MSLLSWTLLAGLLTQSGTVPVDPQAAFSQQLTAALTDAAETAGDDVQKILVLVHADMRSQADLSMPIVRSSVRTLVSEAFDPVGRRALTSTDAEELLRARAGSIRPSDVARIDDPSDFDAVLAVTYSRRNNRRLLRLVLVSRDSSLWHRTLSIPHALQLGEGSVKAAGAAQPADDNSGDKPAKNLARDTAAAAAGSAVGGTRAGGGRAAGTGSGEAAAKAAAAGSKPGELGRKVLEFAVSRLNQQVGNGECWTLAAEALIAAGARPARGYTFGRELADGEAWLPGDIMQFTSAKFVEGGYWKLLGLPNHTAVVYAVSGNKTWILHQNYGGKTVTLLELDMSQRTEGRVQVFRAIPPE